MSRKTEDTAAFTAAIKTATANIGTLTPKTTIAILGWDGISTENDVREALKRDFTDSLEINRVNLTKPAPRGNRVAFCEIDEASAIKVLDKARIKIRWVNCRIRLVAQVTRCFKCHGFGHQTRNCTGLHNSKCCYKCGEEIHKSVNCTEKLKCFLCTSDKDAQDSLCHIAGSGTCTAFRTTRRSHEKAEMTRLIQGNLNRCALAPNLLRQRIFEDKIDICLICEQHRNIQDKVWFTDGSSTAAIWIANTKNITVDNSGSGSGFVWIKTPTTYFMSVYHSPNEGIRIFRRKIADIEDVMDKFNKEVIVTSDFNAKLAE
ncbi:uncharacterized protein LOC141534664 [Cotesia typhae]|uniref:uncharacterized protein LOC141534664 n=1 Tax=Cotesia typhae TaxID=2053667 RepID=UPI003D69C26A